MSQEVMAQSTTVEAQLSVHRSLKDTAKALKETRIDRPFPPKKLLRLQRSLGFVFKCCEAHHNHERHRSLQTLGFANLIVCCMSFSLSSMLIPEFDFMMTWADDFVRAYDLKRRLYHPEVAEQIKKSEYDIEHRASRDKFLTDYYKYDFHLYMGGVPSYVPQPGLREFSILSQIEDEGYIELQTPQARLLTENDVKAILSLQEFTPGQITLLLPGKLEVQSFIVIGLTTKCTKALNERLAKRSRGNSETQPHEQRRKVIEGTLNLTKNDIETMSWHEEDTGPSFFVPSTNIHRPSYIAVTIIWEIAWLFIQKHSWNLGHTLNDRGFIEGELHDVH